MGILRAFKKILDLEEVKDRLENEVCWSLSNIAAESKDSFYANALIECGIIIKVIKMIASKGEKTAKECVWTLANMTQVQNKEVVEYLVQNGSISSLCTFLEQANTFYNASVSQLIALQCIEGILIVNRKYVHQMEQHGLTAKLNGYIVHCNHGELIQKAMTILETYFDVIDDDSE